MHQQVSPASRTARLMLAVLAAAVLSTGAACAPPAQRPAGAASPRTEQAGAAQGMEVPATSTETAAVSSSAATDPATDPAMGSIGGVYEVCIGTRDLEAMIAYWQQFGFEPGPRGELSEAEASALYGVSSRLTAVRMLHQDADHGLVRIMAWDKPRNAGLGMRMMRGRGNRWGAMLTRDVLAVANHAEVAKKAGQDIHFHGPMWDVIYGSDKPLQPFRDQPAGVRELMLIRPETRQFLFQRYNYALPLYGKVNDQAPLPTSQFTHVGLIIQDDSGQALRFYEQVLGLLRVRDKESVNTYESSTTGRYIFQLAPGEQYFSGDFDDPRSSRTELARVRSGRLKIIRYPESLAVADVHDLSRPGSLGMSLYTYRVRDIEDYHRRVSASAARQVTPILNNEFGERSFSFVAPDGYFWTLIELPYSQRR